jgi:D-alanine--poly(phosphoribitol) ligase subunit 2
MLGEMESGKIEKRLFELVEAVTFRKVAMDEPLLDSGLVDSISAVDLALQVEAELGVAMPSEKIHEHMRTLRTLTSYVLATRH